MQVGEGSLDNPALSAESGAVFGAASRDQWLHSERADEAAVLVVVVAAVTEHDVGAAPGPAALALTGSPEVMREQWQRLLEVGALRNVEIQVMPAGRGFHPGKNGPFVVVETHEHKHLGYFESQGVGCVVSEPAEVSAFALRYGKLRSQALNVEESARLIERMVGET